MRSAVLSAPLSALAATALAATLLTGCSKSAHSPPGNAAGAPAADATAPPLTPGSPQIVTTPDLVHLEYHVYGRGDPVVVLVHGWSCSSSYWSAQIADLAARYTVVTLDLGGFGASGRNRDDWSMAAFGEDVATVAGLFRNRPLVLVGHSMGGPVVIEAARILGNRVIGVIGVDAFKSLDRAPPAAAAVEARLQPLRADFIGETRKLVSGPEFFTANADPLFVRKVADDMSRARPEVAIPAYLAMQTWDARPALARIQVPIIAIDSDLGGGVDEARTRQVAPTFRLITVPGTGDFLMMEAPQRFNPILIEAIGSLATGSPRPDRR
jgi:pimeloyl-ACP methyl ester carboxylesterase